MNHNWTFKKLGEVCDVINGFAFKSDKFRKEGLPILRISNIQNDEVKEEGMVFFSLSDYKENMANYEVLPGDIVIAMSGATTGKIGVHTGSKKYYLNQRVGRFVIKESYINRQFLYYYLKTISQKILNDAMGVAQPNISSGQIKNYPIPLPTLETQSRIVAELDLLQSIIDKQKAQLAELDNLAQCIFYDMFGDPVENDKGWEVKTIGEIGKVERGAGISKKDFVENGLPCIHYGQLHTCLGPTTHKHKTCIPPNLLPKYKIAHPGDVVMAITSEDVEGSCKSTAWLGTYDVVIGSDAAIFHHSINGVYISYYTQTKAFFNEKAKYAKGFKVTHISTTEIESIPISLPPLSLQQSFAAKIESIEKQKAAISKSIAETEKLFEYTMDKYFD